MLKFTKMHGCGNDYVYFNCFDQEITTFSDIAIAVSDRHRAIGGDGAVFICPSDKADATMRMFNIDGSEGMMCGNAIRCVAKYLVDYGMVDTDTLTVETKSGIKTLTVTKGADGKVDTVKVDMGAAIWTPSDIPCTFEGEQAVTVPLTVDGVTYPVTAVSMGNPHCVLFLDEIDGLDLVKIGPSFEHHEAFPERVNTEFVKIIDDQTLQMRVWERGSGETHACGTGACAVVAAAVKNGVCKADTDITVKLKGGDLVIRYTDQTVWMTGKAEEAFTGCYPWQS